LSTAAITNREKSESASSRNKGRNNVLVKSFDSSRDEKEIEKLVEQARIYNQQQARHTTICSILHQG